MCKYPRQTQLGLLNPGLVSLLEKKEKREGSEHMKLARIVERLLGPHAYFYFGVRHAAALSSGFTRERALDQAMSYAHASEIEGDYLEFGVWRGRAFSAACYLARKRGLPMKFYAFDSFCGFPTNDEQDVAGRKWYHEGVYKYSERRIPQICTAHWRRYEARVRGPGIF